MEEKFKQSNSGGTPESNKIQQNSVVDSDVDKVVDQIVNEESDELLEAQDRELERDFTPPTENRSKLEKIKGLIRAWWDNKRLRYITLAGTAVFLITMMFVPVTRYGIMNLFGVRVSTNMTIVDSTTGLPLKNIPVKLQGQEVKSNEDGYVSFEHLKQGRTILKVDKRGYTLFEKPITLGWGSNPIGDQSIVASGSQYTFVVQDWLSKKPLKDAEATSGEDVAKSDDQGKIILTVGDQGNDTEAVINVKGYREEKLSLDSLKDGENIIDMVPAKKHAFVSNRNGEYDLYKIDVDGKNEEVLLGATGKEREVPFVSMHPDRDVVAYVSSRDGNTNKDKFILDGLFVIDVISGDVYNVTRSEQIQIIGWSGNKLIYVAVVEGVSAGNSQRSKLIAFDLDSKERTELASSNYFNDVKLINDTVYYAVSSYAVPQSTAKLFSIGVDSKNKKTAIDEQVWSIMRKDYSTLVFSTESQKWYEQEIGKDVKKLDTQPVIRSSRIYTKSPDGKNAVWTDVRDGKGVLLSYNTDTKSDSVLVTEPGLSDPVYWLNDTTLVYRVSTNQETADYVYSLNADGKSHKIVNVVGNLSRYFYQ